MSQRLLFDVASYDATGNTPPLPGWKRCIGDCGQWLPPSSFSKDSCRKDGRDSRCRRCHGIKSRRRSLHFTAYLARAKHRCEVCGIKANQRLPNGRKAALALDHDHETGKPRGILCEDHNHLIAKSYDDPEILRAAIRYLESR